MDGGRGVHADGVPPVTARDPRLVNPATGRLWFTAAARRRIPQDGFGFRMTNDWNAGDLPAPFAAGDVIEVPPGAKALERMHGMGPGVYVVSYGPSIDEGDAWYFRLSGGGSASGRLHVAYADRSSWDRDVDWLAGCVLLDTADPDGLAERRRLIAAGWTFTTDGPCPTCGHHRPATYGLPEEQTT